MDRESVASNTNLDRERDFAEFRPSKYIRIPFESKKAIKKAQFYVNGVRYDNREFAPENTSYHKLLQYQTYDITLLLQMGKNVFGIIIGDGWWCGRVGTTV